MGEIARFLALHLRGFASQISGTRSPEAPRESPQEEPAKKPLVVARRAPMGRFGTRPTTLVEISDHVILIRHVVRAVADALTEDQEHAAMTLLSARSTRSTTSARRWTSRAKGARPSAGIFVQSCVFSCVGSACFSLSRSMNCSYRAFTLMKSLFSSCSGRFAKSPLK